MFIRRKGLSRLASTTVSFADPSIIDISSPVEKSRILGILGGDEDCKCAEA